jgi:hypothetical protein
MYGLIETKGAQPAGWQAGMSDGDRDDYVAELMKAGRPVKSIAETIGQPVDYTRKIVRRIKAERGITYERPKEKTIGSDSLTEASAPMRRRLADHLNAVRERLGAGLSIRQKGALAARAIGVFAKTQNVAIVRPFNHDWSLTQIERLAKAQGEEFRDFIVKLVLSPEEYAKVVKCLSR